MISVNLVTFLKTGIFGGLRLGMTGQKVRALIGEPEMMSVSGFPRIWKYGRLEVALDENRLVSTAVYFERGRGRCPKKARFVGWKAGSTISIAAFDAVCRKHGIGYRPHPLVQYDDWVGFETESGVSAYFHRDGRWSSLASFQLSNKDYLAARAALRLAETQDLAAYLERKLENDHREKSQS